MTKEADTATKLIEEIEKSAVTDGLTAATNTSTDPSR